MRGSSWPAPVSCTSDACAAGPAGGDDAVAGEPGGFAVALEEGAVGHHELDFDAADPAGGAGDAFDQGASAMSCPRAGVPGGAMLSAAAQGGVPATGRAVRERPGREQGGEVVLVSGPGGG